MIRLQSFKFELLADGAVRRLARRAAGCRRFVYNRALALQQARYARGEPRLSYGQLSALLPAWKREWPWLAEAPAQALQQTLMDLDRAYKNLFEGRAGPPKFKKKGRGDAVRFPQGFALDEPNARIFLPKLGWLRYRRSRDVVGELSQVTLSIRDERLFVSMQTEREAETPRPCADTAVGIDVGVARFATLSDGRYFAPRDSFRRHEEPLARAQRRLSHVRLHSDRPFSKNYLKQRRRVQKLHTRICHVRHDYLHQLSSTISQNHALVAIEDLDVRNMTASAAGTLTDPGRGVRAKSTLNKAILDQGWGEFRRQLKYKCAWRGVELILVAPHGTSQECPECHYVSPANRRSQALFHCAECHFEDHADRVGAINILSRAFQGLRDQGQDTGEASPGRETAARIAWEVSRA